ncbi:MAG: zf-HC2 domain-containing protein [Gammaproteobacteria bacterium]
MKLKDQPPYAHHKKVWELLPWYLNGSLNGLELNLVKDHLRVCLLCRKEVADQEVLYDRLRHATKVTISSQPSFERLISRISKETPQPISHGKANIKILRCANWKDYLPLFPSQESWTLTLAAGLLIIILPWLVVYQVSMDEGPAYHTVANRGSLGSFEKNDIRVVFVTHTDISEISEILSTIDGQIVDGPTKLGIFTIRIKDGEAASLPQILETLREKKAVIFAEPARPIEGAEKAEDG